MNESLRNECKLLKALQGISYKELAEYLEIRQDSFYSWLKGYYDLGEERSKRLQGIITNLKETWHMNDTTNFVALEELGYKGDYIITQQGLIIARAN